MGHARTARALRATVAMPWRAQPVLMVGQAAITLADGLAPVIAAWLLRSILDSLTGGRPADMWPLVGALAVASGVQGVLTAVGRYLATQSGRAIERYAHAELFGVVGQLGGLRRLEDPAFLDRLNMAQRASVSGPGQAFTSAINTVQAALTVTGFLAALLTFSPVMALVVLVASVPAMVAEIGVARRRAAMYDGISHAERRQSFYAGLLTSLPAAKELRLFGLGPFFRARMLRELRTIHRAGQRVDRRELVVYGLLSALSAAVAAIGIWWAISAALRGRITVGDVSLFIAALAATASSLTGIVANAAMAYQAVLMLGSYTDVVTEGPDLPVPAQPAPVRILQQGIRFEDVWFRYGPDRPWVLRGVSFTIPYGRSTALVGRNGAGKSTLVKLMCRFYDPDAGRILWDGTDLRAMDPAGLRSRITAVFQDYMTYELSAGENIALSDTGLIELDGAMRGRGGAIHGSVVAAARRAGIHETLAALPKGYDTLLTNSYFDLADKDDPQTGVLLSGGQWQRVALARALLRGGRDLVILDEPSSGLDAEAEYEIHRSLTQHCESRTTVLISHRMNAVRDADTILVFAGGRVTETGDHHTLMTHGGTYARLFSLQARGYAADMTLPG